MIKHIRISDVLIAAAMSAAMLMYGAEEWYMCIIPLTLLLAACIINFGRSVKNVYGTVMLVLIIASLTALCLSRADRHNGIHTLEVFACFIAAFYAGGMSGGRRIKAYILTGASLAAAIGLASYLGILRAGELVMLDGGVRRLQSVFRYANTAAVVFGCGYYMSLDVSDDKNIWGRALSWLNLLAMYLTFSKAALTAFMVICAVLAAMRRGSRKRILTDNGICIAVAIAMLAIYLLRGGGSYASAQTMIKRLTYMCDALGALKDNAILGAGGGAWRYLQYTAQSAGYSVLHIHNGWLEYWLENGIVFVLCMMLPAVSAVKRAASNKDFTAAAAIALVALHSFVDFDLSFGSVLIMLGLLMGNNLTHYNKKAAVTNICVIGALCIAVCYMSAEYIVRRGFESSYIDRRYDEALERAEILTRICPRDSELKISIASLDSDRAGEEIENALRLSPLDPEIMRAKAHYELLTGGDIMECLKKYIDMAPKQEKTYAIAKEYAKEALRNGVCTQTEFDEFMLQAEGRRVKDGVTDRNKLLEEIAEERNFVK